MGERACVGVKEGAGEKVSEQKGREKERASASTCKGVLRCLTCVRMRQRKKA